jgi:hypothetical protein
MSKYGAINLKNMYHRDLMDLVWGEESRAKKAEKKVKKMEDVITRLVNNHVLEEKHWKIVDKYKTDNGENK